eukprot:SAG11_NODE_10020_length_862_cov_1.259502_2_plen_143_part_00
MEQRRGGAFVSSASVPSTSTIVLIAPPCSVPASVGASVQARCANARTHAQAHARCALRTVVVGQMPGDDELCGGRAIVKHGADLRTIPRSHETLGLAVHARSLSCHHWHGGCTDCTHTNSQSIARGGVYQVRFLQAGIEAPS